MALTNHFSIPYMLTSKGSVEDNSLTVQHSLSRNLSNSLSGRMSFGRGFVSRTLAKTVQAVSEVSESTLVEKGSCLDVGDAKNQSNRSALAHGIHRNSPRNSAAPSASLRMLVRNTLVPKPSSMSMPPVAHPITPPMGSMNRSWKMIVGFFTGFAPASPSHFHFKSSACSPS